MISPYGTVCFHIVEAHTDGVAIYNDRDSYYLQLIKSPAELFDLIGQLTAAAREVWGPKPPAPALTGNELGVLDLASPRDAPLSER